MALDAHGWRERFQELRNLKDGWYGDAVHPSSGMNPAGMARLLPVLEMLFTFIPAPRMFPWVAGTLNLEWHEDDGIPDTLPSAEIFPASSGLRAELLAGIKGDTACIGYVALDVDLATAEGRALFIAFIQARMAPALPPG